MTEMITWLDLFTWGQEHHYPQLVLVTKDVIRHGEQAWLGLAVDEKRFTQALQRVLAWQARIAAERTA